MEHPDPPPRAPTFPMQVAERGQGRPFGLEPLFKSSLRLNVRPWVCPPPLDHFLPEADPREPSSLP